MLGLSDYWSEIRKINNDDTLTQKEKKEKTEAVRQKINETAERIVKQYKEATKK